MHRFGEVLKYNPDTFARYNELTDRYLPPPDDDILTFTGTAAEYLSQIRANLLQRIAAHADRDEWPSFRCSG